MSVKLKPWYVSEQLHHQMEDPCQGKSLLKAKEAILPMHDREALHHHQTGTGNIKQMK